MHFDVAKDHADFDVSGTSFIAAIKCSMQQIKLVFGEPTYVGDIDGKIRCEWLIEFYEEERDEYTTATIYDWKDDKPLVWVTDWHVGGYQYGALECIERAFKEKGIEV